MTWVRFDDGFPIHRKVAVLSDGAYRLLTEGICWSARNLTNGFIGHEEVTTVSVRAKKALINELVSRGNWHAAGHSCEACAQPISGWVIHDYLKYQPTRDQVEEDRRQRAERTRLWRERKAGKRTGGDASRTPSRDASQPTAVTHHEQHTYADGDASPGDASPYPYPPRPVRAGRDYVPPAPVAANGGGPAASGEPKTICRICGNATTSAYHRNTCLRSDVIAEGFR